MASANDVDVQVDEDFGFKFTWQDLSDGEDRIFKYEDEESKMPVEELAAGLKVDLKTGIDSSSIALRTRAFGSNAREDEPPRTYWEEIMEGWVGLGLLGLGFGRGSKSGWSGRLPRSSGAM